MKRFITLRDPDHRIRFAIVNEVDRTGRLLQAPSGLAGAKAPQNPTLAADETPTVRSSRGFEAVALSRDGRTLYPTKRR